MAYSVTDSQKAWLVSIGASPNESMATLERNYFGATATESLNDARRRYILANVSGTLATDSLEDLNRKYYAWVNGTVPASDSNSDVEYRMYYTLAPTPPPETTSYEMVGANVSAWNTTDAADIWADADALGINTITIAVRVAQPTLTANAVTVDAASLAFAKTLFTTAKYRGLRVIVEPYPWVQNGDLAEMDINPADKTAWFASWQSAINTIASNFPGAWGLYVASNHVTLEPNTTDWVSLIRAVKAANPTFQVIYRTNWWFSAPWDPPSTAAYQAKLNNALFAEPDIISISAYFELTALDSPTKAQIQSALHSTTYNSRGQDVVSEVMAFKTKWNKTIMFGELACPSVNQALSAPWNPTVTAIQNTAIQKAMLEAYVAEFDITKIRGFSIFLIGHTSQTNYDLSPSAKAYMLTL